MNLIALLQITKIQKTKWKPKIKIKGISILLREINYWQKALFGLKKINFATKIGLNFKIIYLMSQIFDNNNRTKKNLKTPKEIIWEAEEINHINKNFFQKIIYKFTWIFLLLIRFLLYPLFDFKIGLLYSDKIGRFLGNTEFYLRKKSLGNNKKILLHVLISGGQLIINLK